MSSGSVPSQMTASQPHPLTLQPHPPHSHGLEEVWQHGNQRTEDEDEVEDE